MLGKTLLAALVLTHTFSAHGTEVRAIRTTLVLACFFFVGILSTVLARLIDFGFAADKILIGKADKVGVEQDNFGLCLCLFCALRTNGDGLFIVGGQGYIILFQWFFLAFNIKFFGLSGYSLGQNLRTINGHHSFRGLKSVLQFPDRTIKNR